MTLNDLEWLFYDKMRFWPALLESERFNVRNRLIVQPSAILRCSVHFTIYMYLYLYSCRRETARQLRIHAELLVWFYCDVKVSCILLTSSKRILMNSKEITGQHMQMNTEPQLSTQCHLPPNTFYTHSSQVLNLDTIFSRSYCYVPSINQIY